MRALPAAKLLEATGLAFVLISWGMDWGASQRWASAKAELRAAIDVVENYHNHAFLQAAVRREGALTRATADSDPLGSAEVRQSWYLDAGLSVSYFDSVVRTLDNAMKRSHLESPTDYAAFKAATDAIRTQHEARLLQGDSVILSKPAIPRRDTLRSEINETIRRFDEHRKKSSRMIQLVNEALDERTNRNTSLYRALFALGSILVVGAKLAEWWAVRRGDA